METMGETISSTDAIVGMWNHNYGPWLKSQPSPLISSYLVSLYFKNTPFNLC